MNVRKLKKLFEASKDKYGDAKKMGTTYQNITNILNGADPKVSTLEGIAKFYGVPVGYFFDELDDKGKTKQANLIEKQRLEIERLKGQINGMKEALDRLGLSLQGHLDN